jgi:serine protease Do
MSVLIEIGKSVGEVAERAAPSVVGLGRGWGRGSGVIVAPGQVLTCAHVLRGEEVAVTIGDDAVPGRIAGADPDLDIAVIAAETGDAPAIAWDPAALDGIGIGTPVIAVADPGGRGLRATAGFVSSARRTFRLPRGRRLPEVVEHTAPLPRGSSGGPLLDLEGRLLGINAVRLDGGLILAIPADAALRDRIAALARGEETARPRLGVAVAPSRAARRIRAAAGLPEREGLLVRAVAEDSPAANAGLRRGDLLVASGDRPLHSLDDLLDLLEGAPAELALTVVRGTEETEVVARFIS